MDAPTSTPSPDHFVQTRWTLVLRARGDSTEARRALGELCEAYWQPVFRFLQREGRDTDTARELTQAFFARLLQRGDLGHADPNRGRFRSYLLGAVKHFLADLRKHAAREKRCGGLSAEPIAAPPGEEATELPLADPASEVPDAWFDRQWALTVMERALNAVEAEFVAAGRADHFAHFQPWLMGDAGAPAQAETARSLGMSESAVKVAVHRLRKRFRERLRAEVSQTLLEGETVDAELRYLIAAVAQGEVRPG
ncbi:MAG: sigma-70 family RNA polymerase sigma factor [Verrucomicrobia bacterium]|nr:sigma-70 family RNA polymerase sigma factor [Verrucomicrobiota bacterium]